MRVRVSGFWILLVVGGLGVYGGLPLALANVGEVFGLGSRVGALAGAGVAGGTEGYGAYLNPAAGPGGNNRLLFSWGLLDMEPRFKSIDSVVKENNYTSDRLTSGSVDTSYRSILGQTVGLSYLVSPSFLRFAFNLALFSPLNQMAYVDSGEAFLPEYVLYRARLQRPQVDFGFSFEPVPSLRVGVGFHVGFATSTNATVLMQTDQAKPSTLRFSASVKPRVAPAFGLLWSLPGFSVGSVLRLPVKSPYYLTLNAGARALGSLPILDFNFSAASTLFYDPLTVEVGTTLTYLPHLRLILQADYQAWGNFSAPMLKIESPSTGSGGVSFSPSRNPSFEYQNILIPRVAHEIFFESVSIRLGYATKKSIFKNLPTGAGNYLDPPKQIATLGVGLQFPGFLGFNAPCSLDFHAAYHALETQSVSKTPGDESGSGSGATKIGAPSYEAGGKVVGGGVSLTLAL